MTESTKSNGNTTELNQSLHDMNNSDDNISKSSATPEKKENLFINIIFNIVIPTVVLSKFSGESALGVKGAIIVALAFPIAYGIKDFGRAKKVNFFSALGVVSVLLTGGISLLELDAQYIAIKEAAIPALFGIATLISLKTRYPLVRTFLYNDKVMQTDKVSEHLKAKGTEAEFNKTLINASYMIAASFLMSSILNFVLAKWLLVSPPGTEAFNAELGKMTAYSYIVIMVPSMLVLIGALFYLFKQIGKLTGLKFEELFVEP